MKMSNVLTLFFIYPLQELHKKRKQKKIHINKILFDMLDQDDHATEERDDDT